MLKEGRREGERMGEKGLYPMVGLG